jgi:hypothetical protein
MMQVLILQVDALLFVLWSVLLLLKKITTLLFESIDSVIAKREAQGVVRDVSEGKVPFSEVCSNNFRVL